MADITPKFNPGESAPNWTGSSQRPDASAYRADKSMETLFSGVGELISGATTSLRTKHVDEMKSYWEGKFNPVRDAQGVGDATESATVGVSNPASNLDHSGKVIPSQDKESFAERAQKLQAAKADNRISNSYYYSQLNALTRQMKARFPGYGEEVDAIVQKTTGVIPANALRSALLEEMEKNSTKAEKEKKAEKDFIDSNIHLVDPDTRRAIQLAVAKGEDTRKFYPSVYAQASEVNAREAQVKRESAEFARLEHENKSTERLATEALIRRATDFRTIGLRDAMQQLGGPESKIMQALAGKIDLSAQETEQLGMLAERMEQNYRQGLDRILDQKDSTGKSLRERIPATQLDNLVQQQIAPITSLKNAIINDKTGLAGHYARILTQSSNQRVVEIHRQHNSIATYDALIKAGLPKEHAQVLVQGDTNLLNEVTKAVRDTMLPKVMTGKATVSDLVNELKKGGASTRPEFHSALDKVSQILAVPVPHEVQLNTAKALFATKNIVDKFPGKNFEKGSAGDGAQIFTRMMRPDIAASMKKLDEKFPGIYNQYRDWALENFQYAARQLGHNVAAQADNRYLKYDWDSNSNQFIMKLTPEAKKFLDSRGIKGDNEFRAIAQSDSGAMKTVMAVDQLNKALLVVNPLLAETNMTTTDAMQNLFKAWGIDKNKPEQPGFFDGLFDALKRGAPKKTEGMSPGLEGLFGSTSTVNFQKASGDNTGTGSQTRTVKVGNQEVPVTGSPDISRLSPDTKKLVEGLAEDGLLDEVPIRSGYRDPTRNRRAGGARYSQHMLGGAVDLDISDLSDEQKTKVLEAAIARGARGIGIYPGGKSLHVDLRQSSPVSWGPSAWGRFKGVDISEQPAWAQPALRKMMQLGPRADLQDDPQKKS